jgi:hypothetical protein
MGTGVRSQPGKADRHGQAEKQEPEDEGMYHKSSPSRLST